MRVAALYDIHGNAQALEAVLDEVREAGVDVVVVGGDVLPGPMPRESLARLLELDIPVQFIHGNGDRVVHAQMTGKDVSEVPDAFRDVISWTARQLGPDHERLLAGWPATWRVDIDGLGQVLFCHATPRNDIELFTRMTPEDRLAPVFAGVDASLVVCGHTHMQFDRMVGDVRVVNAGSVGMPFASPPGALLGSCSGPAYNCGVRTYDFIGAAARIRETRFPQAEDLGVRYVLQPPSEAESLALFGPGELQ